MRRNPSRPHAQPVNRTRDPHAGKPQAVGDVLARFLERTGMAPKVEAAAVIPEWADRVGPGIAAVTEPLRISDGTLVVAVSTSAWLMELNMMKADLMRHLNAGKAARAPGRIEQIIFVMGGGEVVQRARTAG
jgi:predicted nucleic acid-binding Zn ribbon protein